MLKQSNPIQSNPVNQTLRSESRFRDTQDKPVAQIPAERMPEITAAFAAVSNSIDQLDKGTLALAPRFISVLRHENETAEKSTNIGDPMSNVPLASQLWILSSFIDSITRRVYDVLNRCELPN